MPEQPLSQGPVPAFYNALVPMEVNTPASNRISMFRQHLADRAHELTPRVNLDQFRPLQRTSPTDARQSFSNLFSLLCG